MKYYPRIATNHFGITIAYDGQSIVRVEKSGVSGEAFDRILSCAQGIRSFFDRSKPGSDWGCDGIGYKIQKDIGHVEVKRSGVGPRKYEQGLKALKDRGII